MTKGSTCVRRVVQATGRMEGQRLRRKAFSGGWSPGPLLGRLWTLRGWGDPVMPMIPTAAAKPQIPFAAREILPDIEMVLAPSRASAVLLDPGQRQAHGAPCAPLLTRALWYLGLHARSKSASNCSLAPIPRLSISAQLLLVLLVWIEHQLLGSLSCPLLQRREQSPACYLRQVLTAMYRLFPRCPPDDRHALRAEGRAPFFNLICSKCSTNNRWILNVNRRRPDKSLFPLTLKNCVILLKISPLLCNMTELTHSSWEAFEGNIRKHVAHAW